MKNNKISSIRNHWRVLIVVLYGLIVSSAGADDIEVFVPDSCNIDEKYRFIFIVDNSGSMSSLEFDQSKITVDAAITHVLDNLPQVQTAVVQYGSIHTGDDHDYNVTVPFTDDKATALNWQRVYGTLGGQHASYSEDHQPGSLAKMRKDNVYAPGGQLDITDGTNVQFIFFTDATRDTSNLACCSSIVAASNTFLSSDVLPMFGEYNVLKNGSVLPGGIKAQFTLLHRSLYPEDAAAGAAIASLGGEYNGDVEVDPDDPDGPGVGPRRYLAGTLSAGDTSDILDLIDQVITEIHFPSETESFSEVSIDIDRVNWATDNRAFVPLFKPSINSVWDGNIKGYFIGTDGLEDTNGLAATTTSDIGPVFAEGAQSFWSQQSDGNVVIEGGAASRLLANRTLMSNVSQDPVLTSTDNSLSDQNLNVTNSLLGVSSDAERLSLLNALPLESMGDPLHTRPVLVNYPGKNVLYAMTNQGFLHAIDATAPKATGDYSGGDELWAFMPKELLKNIAQFTDAPKPGDHMYGLDGKITRWHTDNNGDGIVNESDTLVLIIGMRRGGRSYYAIDVTNSSKPILKWQITGGVTAGFGDLMQTWSKMSLISVRRSGVAATGVTKVNTDRVLVFGGGYDAGQLDDQLTRLTSGGGAIYMVDKNGSLIWKTEDQMNYAIPSDLAVVDSDADGLVDLIYAPDLGGQIWRVDFDDVNIAGNFSVKKFASLGENSYQPFFNPPGITLAGGHNNKHFTVSIGSGNRDHPLDATSKNRFYMLKDINTDRHSIDTSIPTIVESKLYDVTNYNSNLGSDDATILSQAETKLNNSAGWMIRLQKGEKSLSKVTNFDGMYLATTYTPAQNSTSNGTCGTSVLSTSRLYIIDTRTGSPISNDIKDLSTGGNKPLKKYNRQTTIAQTGIPSSPSIIFPENSSGGQVLVNKEVVSEFDLKLYGVYWYVKD